MNTSTCQIFLDPDVYEALHVETYCNFTDETEVSDSSCEDETAASVEEVSDVDGKEESLTKVTYKIVFVTSEAAPYSKTGGLGDVCGSLPIALAGRGHRVMVVSPRYLNGTPADKKFAGAFDLQCRIKIYCFGGEQEVAFFHEYREGVDWVRITWACYENNLVFL